MTPALELRGVTARYGARTAVADVSVDVPAGSWLGIIGPNGAGKSTLLKAVVRVAGHDGEILVGGRPAAAMSRRELARAVAYSPQSPVLPERLTVLDYVLLGRTPHLGPLAGEGPHDLAVVEQSLRRLDLAGSAGRRLQTLSGGERQRAVLARVLAQQAGLLLLDEPTTGLDVGHAQQLLELVDRLRREDGTTVVSTLHDLTLAGQYADHVLLLDGGAVVASGAPSEVLTAERLATHYGADVQVLTLDGRLAVVPVRPPV